MSVGHRPAAAIKGCERSFKCLANCWMMNSEGGLRRSCSMSLRYCGEMGFTLLLEDEGSKVFLAESERLAGLGDELAERFH